MHKYAMKCFYNIWIIINSTEPTGYRQCQIFLDAVLARICVRVFGAVAVAVLSRLKNRWRTRSSSFLEPESFKCAVAKNEFIKSLAWTQILLSVAWNEANISRSGGKSCSSAWRNQPMSEQRSLGHAWSPTVPARVQFQAHAQSHWFAFWMMGVSLTKTTSLLMRRYICFLKRQIIYFTR